MKYEIIRQEPKPILPPVKEILFFFTRQELDTLAVIIGRANIASEMGKDLRELFRKANDEIIRER